MRIQFAPGAGDAPARAAIVDLAGVTRTEVAALRALAAGFAEDLHAREEAR